jgi:hypothetical protein
MGDHFNQLVERDVFADAYALYPESLPADWVSGDPPVLSPRWRYNVQEDAVDSGAHRVHISFWMGFEAISGKQLTLNVLFFWRFYLMCSCLSVLAHLMSGGPWRTEEGLTAAPFQRDWDIGSPGAFHGGWAVPPPISCVSGDLEDILGVTDIGTLISRAVGTVGLVVTHWVILVPFQTLPGQFVAM